MHHSVELSDVHVSIEGSSVLRGVSIEARPCEFVAIAGANGAGKTTLLKVINGTLTPDSGKVTVLHEDLINQPNPNLSGGRSPSSRRIRTTTASPCVSMRPCSWAAMGR